MAPAAGAVKACPNDLSATEHTRLTLWKNTRSSATLPNLQPMPILMALAALASHASAQTFDAKPTPVQESSGGVAPEAFPIHGQATFVDQANLAFRSSYRGPNSLSEKANGRETVDVTAYLGVRPWKGAELWINPEIDQGFGLQNTLGVAGFLSGEA